MLRSVNLLISISSGVPSIFREYEALVPMFEQMAELAALLREKRHKRGSIDFDFPETKQFLDFLRMYLFPRCLDIIAEIMQECR